MRMCLMYVGLINLSQGGEATYDSASISAVCEPDVKSCSNKWINFASVRKNKPKGDPLCSHTHGIPLI